MSSTPEPQTMAACLLAVSGPLADILAMATGQRAAIEAAGFSPTAAEQMAAALYVALLTVSFRVP